MKILRNVVRIKYSMIQKVKNTGEKNAQQDFFYRGAFDSAKNHKRQRRKRQSVTAKREKSQTPKFV